MSISLNGFSMAIARSLEENHNPDYDLQMEEQDELCDFFVELCVADILDDVSCDWHLIRYRSETMDKIEEFLGEKVMQSVMEKVETILSATTHYCSGALYPHK